MLVSTLLAIGALDDTPSFITQPATGAAIFDYALWSATYPELVANVSKARATALFMQAALYLDNTACSIVTDPSQRIVLLNAIVAHLAYLGGAGNADGSASGLVGPITRASEGSVSVGTGLGSLDEQAAFWASSPYGYQYWQLTAPLRTARYVPGPRPYLGVAPYGIGGFGGRGNQWALTWPR